MRWLRTVGLVRWCRFGPVVSVWCVGFFVGFAEILDAAEALSDLRTPPGNRLEKLHGDRANSYSIRVDDQWRICFHWTNTGPEDLEIVSYH